MLKKISVFTLLAAIFTVAAIEPDAATVKLLRRKLFPKLKTLALCDEKTQKKNACADAEKNKGMCDVDGLVIDGAGKITEKMAE